VEWQTDFDRVELVTGSAGNYSFSSPPSESIKLSQIAVKPATKIIQGDWNWQYNRSTTVVPAVRHNNAGDRREVMLWGDGHVEFYQFPPDTEDETDSSAPNPNYFFW
jgi:hypothetical protein